MAMARLTWSFGQWTSAESTVKCLLCSAAMLLPIILFCVNMYFSEHPCQKFENQNSKFLTISAEKNGGTVNTRVVHLVNYSDFFHDRHQKIQSDGELRENVATKKDSGESKHLLARRRNLLSHPIQSNQPRPCENGVDVRSRRQFWAYHDDVNPALFDAFAKNGSLLLIFTVRGAFCSKCAHMAQVTKAAWACSFNNHPPVQGVVFVNRVGPINSIVVECKIPGSVLHVNPSVGETVNVSYRGAGGYVHEYRDVPFCRYPDAEAWSQGVGTGPGHAFGRHPVPVAACTMVKSSLSRDDMRNSDLLVEWIAYHKLQGVSHFLIYAHENATLLRRLLAPLITEGLVVVIDWESPPYNKPLTHRGVDMVPYQFLQTTSCLNRYRGLAEWVGLFDIDEFMQPLAPSATVRSTILHAAAVADATDDNVAALKVASVYFYEGDKRLWANKPLMMQRHLKRSKDWRFAISKCFGRPERILLYEQHQLRMGGNTVEVDPEKVLRFNHYRDIRFDPVADSSMMQYAEAVEADVARIMG